MKKNQFLRSRLPHLRKISSRHEKVILLNRYNKSMKKIFNNQYYTLVCIFAIEGIHIL